MSILKQQHQTACFDRLQDQYRHLHEQPREPDYQRMCAPKGAQQWGPRGPPESRAARIQQLRAEHQQRHRERQGQYPHDEEEDTYEHEIQQWEKTGPVRTDHTLCLGVSN